MDNVLDNAINSDIVRPRRKVLHLSLKSKWFKMIESGVKTEEYREPKKYWEKRLLCEEPYTHVEFSLGYPMRYDITRRVVFELKGIEYRKGREEWGAEKDKNYYVLVLGKKVSL